MTPYKDPRVDASETQTQSAVLDQANARLETARAQVAKARKDRADAQELLEFRTAEAGKHEKSKRAAEERLIAARTALRDAGYLAGKTMQRTPTTPPGAGNH